MVEPTLKVKKMMSWLKPDYSFMFVSYSKAFSLEKLLKSQVIKKYVRSCFIDPTDTHLIKKILSFPTARLLSEIGRDNCTAGQRLREFITEIDRKGGNF